MRVSVCDLHTIIFYSILCQVLDLGKKNPGNKASYFQKCLKEHLDLYYTGDCVNKFAFNLEKLLASKKAFKIQQECLND